MPWLFRVSVRFYHWFFLQGVHLKGPRIYSWGSYQVYYYPHKEVGHGVYSTTYPPVEYANQQIMGDFEKSHDFKVVIVGGSVAGLVLAHSLHKAGIDYVVLEGRDHIDPQVGASIGLFSNGSRILDQLGVFESILECTEPLKCYNMLTGQGDLVRRDDSLQLIEARYVMGAVQTPCNDR